MALRLTELRLPLSHTDQDLQAALLRELGIGPGDLAGFTIVRRGYDARKKDAVVLVYHLDVETPREAELLGDFAATRTWGRRRTPPTNSPSRRRSTCRRGRW